MGTIEDAEAAEAAAAALRFHTEAAELIDDPDATRKLLAFALARLLLADAVVDGGSEDLDTLDTAMFNVEAANALRGIAVAARDQRPLPPADAGAPEPDDDEGGLLDEQPWAVRGVRFSVRYVGRDMGTAVWVPRLAAFVSKYGFHELPAPDGDRAVDGHRDCDIVLVAAGRVASATSGAAMVITDQGATLSLDRFIGDYVETPDE